jgi:predicted ATPase
MPDMNYYYPINNKLNRQFSIGNFRVFKEKEEFSFSPLTLLVGPNSSGKSSLMKMFSMFVESAKNYKNSSFIPRTIDGESNHFSKLAICNSLSNLDQPFIITFQCTNKNSFTDFSYELIYIHDKEKSQLKISSFKIKKTNKELLVFDFSTNSNGYNNLCAIQFNLKYIIECFNEYTKTFNNYQDPFFEDEPLKILQNSSKQIFELNNDEGLYQKMLDAEFDILLNLNHNNSDLIQFEMSTLTYEEQMSIEPYNPFNLDNGLKGYFQLILLKIKSHLRLQMKERGVDVNVKLSEFGVYLRDQFSVKLEDDFYKSLFSQFEFHSFPVFKAKRGKYFVLDENLNSAFDIALNGYIKKNLFLIKSREIPSNNIVNEWLDKFEIGKSLKIQALDESHSIFSVRIINYQDKEIDIADLGYGAGNVISLILIPFLHLEFHAGVEEKKADVNYIQFTNEIGWDIPNETLIYLEEPESNLHPNWQSRLAELFVYHQTLNIRYVVETHSEYLIRKIQHLIAHNQFDKKDVAIYYFNSEKEQREYGKPSKYQIGINENGTLSESFGSGFFDEAGRLAMDLLSINSISKN